MLVIFGMFLCVHMYIVMHVVMMISSIYHFSSSVEDESTSAPSGHSWKKKKKKQKTHKSDTDTIKNTRRKAAFEHTVIFIFLCTQLTFTFSSSGLPGRDFCEEKACEVRQSKSH